jgi:hypothetical protein
MGQQRMGQQRMGQQRMGQQRMAGRPAGAGRTLRHPPQVGR